MRDKRDYREFADRLLPLLGGVSNVEHVTHCMTRLRFNLADRGAVQEDAIKDLGVQACIWVGDQFQVVIGSDVDAAYNAVRAVGGFEETEKIAENLDAPKEKGPFDIKTFGMNLLATLAACMAPVLPILIGMGMFASLTAIFGPGFLNVLPAESPLYQLFSLVQNNISYFLSLMVAYSSAQKFGCNPVIALATTCFLFFPDALTALSEGTFNIAGYAPSAATPQVFSVILMCWVLSHVERFFTKIIPSSLQLSLVSFLSLLVMVPVFIYVLAPIGALLGDRFAFVLNSIYGAFPPLVTFLVGFTWVLLIIPGMHVAVGAPFLVTFLDAGVDFVLYPVVFLLTIVGAMTNLGIWFRNKDKKERELCANCTIALVVGGVLEPSLYGLYIEKPRHLLACCTGMGVGGLLVGLLGVGFYSGSAQNFMFFTSYLSGGIQNLLMALACAVAGGIVAFAITATEKKTSTAQ